MFVCVYVQAYLYSFLGTMGKVTGELTFEKSVSGFYSVERDGRTVKKWLDNVDVSNGIGWTADNKTMYYSDTGKRCVCAFDFNLETGTAGECSGWVKWLSSHGARDYFGRDLIPEGHIKRILPKHKLDRAWYSEYWHFSKLPSKTSTITFSSVVDIITILVSTSSFVSSLIRSGINRFF